MTRINAFLIHLGISLLIFLVLLYFIVYHWYPFPYFSSDGGWQGIRIIAAVDLVLGPLLTLIVFSPGKKYLKLDLAIIAIIQFSALSWGVWVTYDQRPHAVIFSDYYFKPITANELRDLNADMSAIASLSKETPYMIYLDLPSDEASLQTLKLQSFHSRQPLYVLHERYKEFSENSIKQMQKKQVKLSDIIENGNDLSPALLQKLKRYAANEQYMYFSLKARYKYEVAVFDPVTYKIIDTIDINPLAAMKNVNINKK